MFNVETFCMMRTWKDLSVTDVKISRGSDVIFVAGAIVFRLVTTLEAYLRTSGELNHHR